MAMVSVPLFTGLTGTKQIPTKFAQWWLVQWLALLLVVAVVVGYNWMLRLVVASCILLAVLVLVGVV